MWWLSVWQRTWCRFFWRFKHLRALGTSSRVLETIVVTIRGLKNVTTILVCLIDWLIDWSVGRSVGRLVGWSVGWLIDQKNGGKNYFSQNSFFKPHKILLSFISSCLIQVTYLFSGIVYFHSHRKLWRLCVLGLSYYDVSWLWWYTCYKHTRERLILN